MMHGFALILVDILGHSEVKELISEMQRVISFVRSSHIALGRLRQSMVQFDIKQGLVSSNTTRFTSVHMAVKAFMGLEDCFKAVSKQTAVNGSGVRQPVVTEEVPFANIIIAYSHPP